MLPFIWLAIIGGYRAPLLALTSLAVLISHSLLAHKEARFIVFTLLSLPILIGLGAATIAERLRSRLGAKRAAIVVAYFRDRWFMSRYLIYSNGSQIQTRLAMS